MPWGFDDPERFENRRGHIGSNVELLVGYFAEGDAYQISHAYKRGLDPILTKVAEFFARKKEAKTPTYIFVVASPAGIAR